MTIIAGTGHRFFYMPCKYDENHEWCVELKKDLIKNLENRDDIEAIISGLALGWDTFLAEAAIELNIPLHAYPPFPDQCVQWPIPYQDRWHNIIDKSEYVHYTTQKYYDAVFMDRNEDMINNCNEVYALWNPTTPHSGTGYTIKLANKQNLPITNFWKEYDAKLSHIKR